MCSPQSRDALEQHRSELRPGELLLKLDYLSSDPVHLSNHRPIGMLRLKFAILPNQPRRVGAGWLTPYGEVMTEIRLPQQLGVSVDQRYPLAQCNRRSVAV